MREPITRTRSLHLPYKPYETTFARIFLFLETVGLLDWRTPYAIQYNIIQYDTAQHNSIQYSALYYMLSLEFKLAWGENCSKNRKIGAKVDSRIYGRWQDSYPFSETNFQDFSRTRIDFSEALKFTLTPTLPRSQC